MMSVRFTVTLVILLSFEALKPEAFPAGPLAAALKRKSFDLAPLPVPSALHDSLSSEEDISVEFVDEALSPRLQCEAISAKRRLHCNDPTGEATEEEAIKICNAHGRDLFMYLPAVSGASDSTVYWSCAQRKPSSLATYLA